MIRRSRSAGSRSAWCRRVRAGRRPDRAAPSWRSSTPPSSSRLFPRRARSSGARRGRSPRLCGTSGRRSARRGDHQSPDRPGQPGGPGAADARGRVGRAADRVQRFREQPFVGQVSGETASGWQLTYVGESLTEPTLAVLRDSGGAHLRPIFASPDGETVAYEHDGVWPWNIVVGGKPLSILQDFYCGAGVERAAGAPASGDSNSPAVVVEAGGGRGRSAGGTRPRRWRWAASSSCCSTARCGWSCRSR